MQSSYPVPEPSTLVELLHQRTKQHPEQIAFSFWAEEAAAETRWTYCDLDEHARGIGARLQARKAAGERVLLLFPPGLDYVVAFLDCLYASAIAVPAHSPRLNRPMPHLQAIVSDAQVTTALTTAQILTSLESRFDHLPDLRHLRWLATDREIDKTTSLSTVLGGLGLAAYATVNAYLDAFARRPNQNASTLWIGVDWDGA